MLEIVIPKQELWDEEKERFIRVKAQTLSLEHSLVSMSEWESKHEKPLLDRFKPQTVEERRDYIRCMTLNEVDPAVYYALTKQDFNKVDEYMNSKQTATTFAKSNQRGGQQFITNELIYCWMSQFNIPYEPCNRWHLNRLLTLIKVCSEENKEPSKVPKGKAMEQQRALNEMRKAQWGTKG